MRLSVARLKELLVEAGLNAGIVQAMDPARPILEQGLDSMDLPLCVLAMEKALGGKPVPETDLFKLKTLDQVLDYLARQPA